MKRGEESTPRSLNPNSLKRITLAGLLTKAGTPTTNTTIGNWIAAGCPTNPDSSLSLIHVCAWLAAERRKKSEKPASSAIEGLRETQKELAAFKLKKLQGQFYERAEVVGMFEEAAARTRAVLEAVERNHGASVGATIRAALKKSFANIEEALKRPRERKS